jgi:hypothetical protein
MLIVTNIAAVDAAFAAKTPRPIEEAIREVYPDCTIDRQGRAHAPYDGYECPITGALFRAGEYLPFEHDDNERKIFTGHAKRIPEAIDLGGKRYSWDGTRAQNIAVWAELLSQTKAHDAISKHVGTVGQMIELRDLTIQYIGGWVGMYGTVWTYVMKDADGNVVVYKGSKRFERTRGLIRPEVYQKGEKISLKVKVKAHSEREGVKQTIVERPKII